MWRVRSEAKGEMQFLQRTMHHFYRAIVLSWGMKDSFTEWVHEAKSTVDLTEFGNNGGRWGGLIFSELSDGQRKDLVRVVLYILTEHTKDGYLQTASMSHKFIILEELAEELFPDMAFRHEGNRDDWDRFCLFLNYGNEKTSRLLRLQKSTATTMDRLQTMSTQQLLMVDALLL